MVTLDGGSDYPGGMWYIGGVGGVERDSKLRAELAILENKPLDQVNQEASDVKQSRQNLRDQPAAHKLANEKQYPKRKSKSSQVIYLPKTAEEQTCQTSLAIGCAFVESITRQTACLALIKVDKPI